MSMSSEITRITSLRNRIRTKLISLGVISDSSADLEDCADGVDSITGISEYRIFEESTNTGIGGNFVTIEDELPFRGVFLEGGCLPGDVFHGFALGAVRARVEDGEKRAIVL